MTTLSAVASGTIRSFDTPHQHHAEISDFDAFIDAEDSGYKDVIIVWKIATELTDDEAAAIERKLDAESSEGKLTFGSAEDLNRFLRSQISRKDE